jgi:hypothetical protein
MQKGVDAMIRLIDESTAPFRGGIAADLGLDGFGEFDATTEDGSVEADQGAPQKIQDGIKKADGIGVARTKRGKK